MGMMLNALIAKAVTSVLDEELPRALEAIIAETHAKTGKLSDLCKAWVEHKKAARQFVKERSKP